MGNTKCDNKRISDNISIKGQSHKGSDKPCQDSSTSWQSNKYGAVIICDGHGGDKYLYSRAGSIEACNIGITKIKAFMDKIYSDGDCKLNKRNYDAYLTRLEQSIISEWRTTIEKKIEKKNPTASGECKKLSDSEKKSLERNPVKAYGTTFIAAVVADEFSFVIQLGDGNATLFYDDGTLEDPEGLEDDTLQFNLTTSMCNDDAAQCFRHCFVQNDERQVIGIVLSSDGVINSFKEKSAYHSFISNVFDAYVEDGIKVAGEELKDTLKKLTERGSGDDLSIAIIRE